MSFKKGSRLVIFSTVPQLFLFYFILVAKNASNCASVNHVANHRLQITVYCQRHAFLGYAVKDGAKNVPNNKVVSHITLFNDVFQDC